VTDYSTLGTEAQDQHYTLDSDFSEVMPEFLGGEKQLWAAIIERAVADILVGGLLTYKLSGSEYSKTTIDSNEKMQRSRMVDDALSYLFELEGYEGIFSHDCSMLTEDVPGLMEAVQDYVTEELSKKPSDRKLYRAHKRCKK